MEQTRQTTFPEKPAAEQAPSIDILLIEDDKFLRTLMASKFEHEGYSVRAAIDGEEGFALLHKFTPKVILLDLVLPGMNGFEVLERLKKQKDTTHTPVIILSNLGQREDVERARRLGAEEFLIKANFTPGEVVEKVRRVMGKMYI